MEYFHEWGYLGLFLGSFLAATIVPFSSDALLVGMLALGGSIPLTLFWATLGNWLGGLTSYWIGYSGKWEWIEKWFRVSKQKLEKQQATVKKYGSWLALFTWLPVIGDLFAVALGFYRAKFLPSATFMLIGKFLRFLLWAILFLKFGKQFMIEL